jgi:hypothetical protein
MFSDDVLDWHEAGKGGSDNTEANPENRFKQSQKCREQQSADHL